MKKDYFQFPWYLIYTPVIAAMLIVWHLDTMSGDGSMSTLEKILNWLGLSDEIIGNIVIIAIAVLALIYIVTKWFSTNKRLKAINKVADTAPDALRGCIGKTEKKICEKIDDHDRSLIRDITEIKSSANAVQRQFEIFSKYRQDVPMQQDNLIAIIHDIYTQHDQDRQTISVLRVKVAQLEEQNVKLIRENQQLEKLLHQRSHQQEIQSKERNDWEPEM